MIYGLTKGTDFEKLCDGAAKAEAAGVMTDRRELCSRRGKGRGTGEPVCPGIPGCRHERGCRRDGDFCQAGRPSWCHLAGYDRKIQEIKE